MPRPRKLSPQKRLALAHHEAGHAVVSHVLGLPPFEFVELVPNTELKFGEAAGRVRAVTRRTSTFQEVSWLLAGPAAEAKHRGWARDKVLWENFCNGGSQSDYAKALAVAKETTSSTDEAHNVIRSFYETTRNIIESQWAVVQKVAQALLTRQRLTWDEFMEVTTNGTPN